MAAADPRGSGGASNPSTSDQPAVRQALAAILAFGDSEYRRGLVDGHEVGQTPTRKLPNAEVVARRVKRLAYDVSILERLHFEMQVNHPAPADVVEALQVLRRWAKQLAAERPPRRPDTNSGP